MAKNCLKAKLTGFIEVFPYLFTLCTFNLILKNTVKIRVVYL